MFRDCLLAGYQNIVLVREEQGCRLCRPVGGGRRGSYSEHLHRPGISVRVAMAKSSLTSYCSARVRHRCARSSSKYGRPTTLRSHCTGKKASTRSPTDRLTTRPARVARTRRCSPRNSKQTPSSMPDIRERGPQAADLCHHFASGRRQDDADGKAAAVRRRHSACGHREGPQGIPSCNVRLDGDSSSSAASP